jgi:hypothetical protein
MAPFRRIGITAVPPPYAISSRAVWILLCGGVAVNGRPIRELGAHAAGAVRQRTPAAQSGPGRVRATASSGVDVCQTRLTSSKERTHTGDGSGPSGTAGCVMLGDAMKGRARLMAALIYGGGLPEPVALQRPPPGRRPASSRQRLGDPEDRECRRRGPHPQARLRPHAQAQSPLDILRGRQAS